MRAHRAGHETVEHTADLAIRAWGPDLRSLIEEAAAGMLDLMLGAAPAPVQRVEVVAEGLDTEELLVDCLREILALWNVDGLLPVSVRVCDIQEQRAVCGVGVVPGEQAAGVLEQEIKAATYHGLEIVYAGDHLEVSVVFDV
jgi:SHS2 domain-containing protein